MTIARLFSLLLFAALALAPLRMFGGEAVAGPHHDGVAMEHCLPEPVPTDEQPPLSKASCMMACSAIPATAPPLPERLLVSAAPAEAGLTSDLAGLTPEAATPPPRRI